MKKIFILFLFYVLTVSVCFAMDSKPDDLFEIPLEVNDTPTEAQKNLTIDNFDVVEEPTFFTKIEHILPDEEKCSDISKPLYLFTNVTTKYFEKGPIATFEPHFAYRGALDFNFIKDGGYHTNQEYSFLETHFKGNFKDNKTSYFIMMRYMPENKYKFMQYLFGDLYIKHQFNDHNSILIGNSRTKTGKDGSTSPILIPFMNYSQIGRTIGNTRKQGIRFMGDYDLFAYDIGGYSSDTYFREFFPGLEFTGWLTFKPLGKTDGRYGKINLSGGISTGKHDSTYTVAGGYASYEYKRFKADFEISDANGYNGCNGISKNHARGYYTTLYYMLNKKWQLVARYDNFQPNVDVTNKSTTEYSCGLNYFIKGQALKLILNYIYRQNDFGKDSHRILLGTQIML